MGDNHVFENHVFTVIITQPHLVGRARELDLPVDAYRLLVNRLDGHRVEDREFRDVGPASELDHLVRRQRVEVAWCAVWGTLLSNCNNKLSILWAS